MELIVIQLWLMARNVVALIVLLVNVKHEKTSMNPLVLNQNVTIPSATVYMLVIIVVDAMINVFGTSCWYPLMEVYIIWYHEKRRNWQIYLAKSIGKNMRSQWLISSRKVDYTRTTWREYCATSFIVSSLEIILLWNVFADLLRTILAQPCWQICTIIRDNNPFLMLSSNLNTSVNTK